MICCPTCGQALPTGPVPVEALVDADLSPPQVKIVAALVRAYPRQIGMEGLIDVLWSADPNGGPDTAAGVIKTQVSRIRHRLAAHGWTIARTKGGRGRVGLYRLERLP